MSSWIDKPVFMESVIIVGPYIRGLLAYQSPKYWTFEINGSLPLFQLTGDDVKDQAKKILIEQLELALKELRNA